MLISILFVLYTYIGYPLLIWILSIIFYRPVLAKKNFYPSISIVISVYNEARYIKKKIESIYKSFYPNDRLEVLIGLDGCTDETFEILNDLLKEHSNLKLYNYPYRRGKAAVLNELIAKVRHNIIIFTDARQLLDLHALDRLVAPLSDPSIGSVSGELVFLDENGHIKKDIGLYWRYEKFIRKCESRFFSMLGATGAFYAMRRECVKRLPENIILDDLYQPFNAIKLGYRAIFQPGAIIYDRIAENELEEFNRKVRTLIGNFQLISMDSYYLSFKNPVFWQFLSHKLCRLFVPYMLAIIYISSFLLVNSLLDQLFFIFQSLFYLLAVYPMATNLKPKNRLLSLPYTFVLLNLAAVVALIKFLRQDYTVKWRK